MAMVIGWKTMKNKSLSIQIWIVFASITLIIELLLAFIIPSTLRSFFTGEIYQTLESAQNIVLSGYNIEDFEDIALDTSPLEDIRMVNHIVVDKKDNLVFRNPLSRDFVDKIGEDIALQDRINERYKFSKGEESLFYIISKGGPADNYNYLISYIGDSYRNDLVETLFIKLIKVMFLIVLLSWIPAIFLSKYLSRPLVELESKVLKLTKRDWQEPMKIDRKDEIGRLGNSLEDLRTQLIKQDRLERDFLQNISHDLKTPVMVIRSFVQAIKDGIFPKEDLDSSLDLIDEEALGLEKRIKELLYFSKLDYLTYEKNDFQVFSLDKLIRETVNKFTYGPKHIDFKLNLKKIEISGDRDKWIIVVENILDNALRYAKSQISINLKEDRDKIILKFSNDGAPIEEEIFKNLFKRYNKGPKGEFGLGLAIVQKILLLHNGSIYAKNLKNGVEFIIELKREV